MTKILYVKLNMGVLKDLEITYDIDIVDEFLDHFEIICETIEPVVLRLKDSKDVTDAGNELFRMIHNLKSASGYLHILVMNHFSSFLEERLEAIRTSNKVLSDEVITWLLKASDQYCIWLNDLQTDSPEWGKVNFSIFNTPLDLM